MFSLRTGYFICGFVTGLILLFHFLVSLPDGKLHIIVCDVGQGDATYIRFADGSDMLVDGGPNDKVLSCLGKYMPFWDRSIDVVLLTHAEYDHIQGLLSVVKRYKVGYFVRSAVSQDNEDYRSLLAYIHNHQVQEKMVMSGQSIRIGRATVSVVWPSAEQIAAMSGPGAQVLGHSTESVNEGSVVFWLRYGSFDALFPGDVSLSLSATHGVKQLADNTVELLKVPHHGSKFGMDKAFIGWLKPSLAIVSVSNNNTYGHPSAEIQTLLADEQVKLLRTDEKGNIEIMSDGKGWFIQ